MMKFHQVLFVIDVHIDPQKSLVTIPITKASSVSPVPICFVSSKAGALPTFVFAPLSTPLH